MGSIARTISNQIGTDGKLNAAGLDLADNFAFTGTVTGALANWTESSGNLLPNNSSYGVYFGVNSATAANLLNDYEEGTFNMTLEGGISNPTVSYYERSASYTKIGNIVQVHGVLYPSSISGGSGNVIISGFPFTASQKGVGALVFDRVRITNASAAYPTTVSVVVEQSTTYMTINEMNDNSDEVRGKVNIDDLATNPYIPFSVTYRTTA